MVCDVQVQRRFYPASPESQRESNCSSPKSTPRDSLNSCPSPEVEDGSNLVRTIAFDRLFHLISDEHDCHTSLLPVGFSFLIHHREPTLPRGFRDHCSWRWWLWHRAGAGIFSSFTSVQGAWSGSPASLTRSDVSQVNGQCSCFQSIELLKTRPAHLAAFLHHVISQFDPAPLVSSSSN